MWQNVYENPSIYGNSYKEELYNKHTIIGRALPKSAFVHFLSLGVLFFKTIQCNCYRGKKIGQVR